MFDDDLFFEHGYSDKALGTMLRDAGLNPELMLTMRQQPELVEGMVKWLREQIKQSSSGPIKLFEPLDVQLENIKRWNEERGWGFTDADFDAIDLTPRHHDEPLVVDVIAVYLPEQDGVRGPLRTFKELREIGLGELAHEPWDVYVIADAKRLRLHHHANHTPGLRRVTLDLGYGWGSGRLITPSTFCNQDSVHADILAAAAHFPKWLRSLDGSLAPSVVIPAYKCNVPSYRAWGMLHLGWSPEKHRPYLYAASSTRKMDPSSACPVRREA